MVMTALNMFHCHYEKSRVWEDTSWLGVPFYKLPFDAIVIQELIWKLRPDYVVETGTCFAGSALFYASIFELIGHGEVVTCDIELKHDLLNHELKNVTKRIHFIPGGSTNPLVFKKIKKRVGGKRNIVLLDSWHTKDHVLDELNLYQELVEPGMFLICEDTHVNSHPVPWEWGDGPYEAVEEFLEHNKDFEVDLACEKFMMTFNPMGYLRRKK